MADMSYMPYAQRAAEIERQRKLAELLQQQYAEPIQQQTAGGYVIPISPLQTVTKLAQAGLGAYMQGKSDKAAAELKKQGAEEAKKYFTDLATYAQKGEKTGETPITTEISGYGATQPLPVLNVQDGKFSQAMQDVYTPATKAGMLARMMEGMSSENPDIAKYASTFGTALMPTTEEYGTPFKSGGQMYTMSKSGNIKALGLAAPTEESTYQRTTKEWSDKAGNKYKQDYAFNPTTKSMEPIGEAYLADVYHAPGTSKDDDTKAAATLRNEYNNHPVVKQHAIVSATYENILNNEDTGAGDMALIYQYIKMLDPTTGVKEGEYASAENTTGIPTRVLALYNKARTGEKLDPSQRSAFISQAGQLYETSKKQAETVRQGIEQIGKDTGVNPRLYPLQEPKRRTSKATEPPAGFVVEPQASQSNFSSPSGSLMFQFPSGR